MACSGLFHSFTGEDFFAVFDGHAGRASAVFAADHFHGVLAKKVVEESEQAEKKRMSDKGKEKDGAGENGKQRKGAFWNKRAIKKSRELSRTKTQSDDSVGSGERTARKEKEDEGGLSDLSGRMSAEKQRAETVGEEEPDEQEPEDSDEESIDFPKTVGEDASKEAQAMFSALVKSFMEMDELMKDNRDGATAVVTLASMRCVSSFGFLAQRMTELTYSPLPTLTSRLNKLFVANVGDARAVLCRRVRASAFM
jgi:serine/threonine protein phosphatase PrpC